MEPDKIRAGCHVLAHSHGECAFFLRSGELNVAVFAPHLKRPAVFAANGGVEICATLGAHWEMPIHLRRGRERE